MQKNRTRSFATREIHGNVLLSPLHFGAKNIFVEGIQDNRANSTVYIFRYVWRSFTEVSVIVNGVHEESHAEVGLELTDQVSHNRATKMASELHIFWANST
jgi:hypothetical protein